MKPAKPSLVIRQVDHNQILFDFSNRRNRLLNFILRTMMFLLPVSTIIVVVILTAMRSIALSILSFCGIVGIFVSLAFAFKNRLLKEIRVSPLGIQFLYYIPMHNHRVPISFKSLDLIVNSTDKKLAIEVFNQKIEFNNAKEFTLFLETFTKVCQLQFEESTELGEGKEVLKYFRT